MSATGTALKADKHQQGVQLYREGRIVEAIQLLGEAIAEGETSDCWNDWAAVQLVARNVSDAEKGLRRALQLDPRNPQAAANLGGVLVAVGKCEEAIPLLERGLPNLCPDEKAIVTQLLEQCRSKVQSPPSAAPPASLPAPSAPAVESKDAAASISKAISAQTSTLNSLSLRLITMEATLDKLNQWLTRAQSAPTIGRPPDASTVLFHRASTKYAITAAAAEGYFQDDLHLVERLLAAYRRSAAEFEKVHDSMWRQFFDERHQTAHKVFMEGDIQLAAAILRNPASSDLFYGFDGLVSSYAKKTVHQGEADVVMDHLIRFAEAVGAHRVDHPLAYVHRQDSIALLDPISSDALVERIEKSLGSKLSFPNPYPGETGIQTSRGIISYRAVPALYHAWRAGQLLNGTPRPRILEIGAGLGRAAYFAWHLGLRDYTVVDIPMTSICQGYFLGRLLGEHAIQLAGENLPKSENRIRILAPSQFLEAVDSYDLVLNADSFTEFSESVARNYWTQIESRARIFLSINHESNSYSVRDFIERSSRVETYDRYPYWIHNGYIEEIVHFKPGS